MRTALLLIVVGALAFVFLSRDLIAEATGRPFMGMMPGQTDTRSSENQRSRSEALDLNGIETVSVETMNGEISVLGPNAGNADATGAFATSPDTVRITERGNVRVSVTRSGNRLSLVATSRPVCFGQCAARFDLNLSRAVRLELRSGNGRIDVSGQAEAIDADSGNGEISLVNTGQAEVNLRSGNGNLELSGVQGRLNANTSNGNITLRQAQPDDLRLESGNGDVTVVGVRFADGKHTMSTSSGTITVREARNASFEIDTSSGEVVLDRVELKPGSVSQATNSGGDIRLTTLSAPDGLALSGSTSGGSQDVQLPGFSVRIEDDRFEANRDGRNPASLKLETSGGSIRLRP